MHTNPRERTRRSDGERSRQAILSAAARLATVEGIEGLSLARLADAVGMSKSGLFAHFGSKEELQLATIDAASAIYDEVVVRPALDAPTGFERLESLCEHFLDHVGDEIFPGGCFFASVAAELDTRPGPVRDKAVGVVAAWLGQLTQVIREAQGDGTIGGSEDPDQLAFELNAFLLLANAQYVLSRDSGSLDRARTAVRNRLALARR
jgi:AcrR family transcriptional regulator